MRFEVRATDGAARRATVTLAHGAVQTPAFMPVGTRGAVKAVTHRESGNCSPTAASISAADLRYNSFG